MRRHSATQCLNRCLHYYQPVCPLLCCQAARAIAKDMVKVSKQLQTMFLLKVLRSLLAFFRFIQGGKSKGVVLSSLKVGDDMPVFNFIDQC